MSTEESTAGSGKRTWLAVVLSLLLPGAGHLYLREWIRSAFWFLSLLLVTEWAIPQSAVSNELSFEGLRQMWEGTPLSAKLLILGLTAICMVDAYWLSARAAKRRSTDTGGTTSCPNCGKELDADLDFCHWCSTELAADAGGSEEVTAGELNRQSDAAEEEEATAESPSDQDADKD